MKGTVKYRPNEDLPEYIVVKYKKIKKYHCFTANDIGLNIANEDNLKAYNQIEPCIKYLIKANYGIDVEVRLADSYGDLLLEQKTKPKTYELTKA